MWQLSKIRPCEQILADDCVCGLTCVLRCFVASYQACLSSVQHPDPLITGVLNATMSNIETGESNHVDVMLPPNHLSTRYKCHMDIGERDGKSEHSK